ncbi:hypothetical protein GCM10009840_13290 [Pseudolysinimonas kribbensis]
MPADGTGRLPAAEDPRRVGGRVLGAHLEGRDARARQRRDEHEDDGRKGHRELGRDGTALPIGPMPAIEISPRP